jgi:hypothetical protein
MAANVEALEFRALGPRLAMGAN